MNKSLTYIASLLMLTSSLIGFSQGFSIPLPFETENNYKVSTGLTIGSLSQKDFATTTLFAIPFTLGIWNHPSQDHSIGLEGSALLDLGSSQIIKYGGDIAYHYHVLGGAQSFAEGGGIIGVKKSFDTNLSLVLKSGYYIYSISKPNSPTQTLQGSVIPIKPGFSFRYGNWESELLISALNLNVGAKAVTDSSIEINFGYRTSL